MGKITNKRKAVENNKFLEQGFRTPRFKTRVKPKEADVVAFQPLTREQMETIGYTDEEIAEKLGSKREFAG